MANEALYIYNMTKMFNQGKFKLNLVKLLLKSPHLKKTFLNSLQLKSTVM